MASAMSRKRWNATVAAEQGKLSSKENDWQLHGNSNIAVATRTRHGGNGRPNRERRNAIMQVADSLSLSASSSDREWNLSENGSDSNQEEEEDDLVLEKPPATRVIVDVEGLKMTLQDNSRCRRCDGILEACLRTNCLATSITMLCRNRRCGFVYKSPPPEESDWQRQQDNRERTTNYAINILYVIGFLSSGDGGVEAARLLGLLGLPNDTTMETRSFHSIECRISPVIQELTNSILRENLIDEGMQSMRNTQDQDDNDIMLWKQWMENKSFCLAKSKYPRIICSFDMGWQQRASGVRYNSQSGHALLVGGLTRKPIAFALKSKTCVFCRTWKRNNKDLVEAAELSGEELMLPYHKCTKNYDGSSGAMECRSCLDMVINLYDNSCCLVTSICCDDDSSTRVMLKWSNADWKINNNTNDAPRVT
jgi:hypothetical protein